MTTRNSITAIVLGLALAACMDEAPEELAEVELALEAESPEFASYHVTVLDARTGKVLFERSLSVDQVVAPSDSRFFALLPAERPLLIDVVAKDASGAEVGSGGALVTLKRGQRSGVIILVLAHPVRPAGLLDATLQPADYPTQDYLLADPAENTPGGKQTIVAHLTDPKTGKPVSDAFTLFLEGAVAPMFSVADDGAVVTDFTWSALDESITPCHTIAYLDGAGHGWIGSIEAPFSDAVTPTAVELSWKGVVPAAGKLPSKGGRWLLGFSPGDGQKGEYGAIHVASDADGDGKFVPDKELLEAVVAPSDLPLFFTAQNLSGVIAPSDLAGVVFDSDGFGGRDTLIMIQGGTHEGVIIVSPWPIPAD